MHRTILLLHIVTFALVFSEKQHKSEPVTTGVQEQVPLKLQTHNATFHRISFLDTSKPPILQASMPRMKRKIKRLLEARRSKSGKSENNCNSTNNVQFENVAHNVQSDSFHNVHHGTDKHINEENSKILTYEHDSGKQGCSNNHDLQRSGYEIQTVVESRPATVDVTGSGGENVLCCPEYGISLSPNICNDRSHSVAPQTIDIKKYSKVRRRAVEKRLARYVETPDEYESRKCGNKIRTRTTRELETAEKCANRRSADQFRTKSGRASESPDKRQSRQFANKIRSQCQRLSDSLEKRERTRFTNKMRTQSKRALESPEKRQSRHLGDKIRTQCDRAFETPEKRKSRRLADKIRARCGRALESPEQRETRLLDDRCRTHAKRLSESPRTRRRRLFHDRSAKAQRFTSQNYLDRIRRDITTSAHFTYKCVSDGRYHCRGNVSKVTLRWTKDQHQLKKNALLRENCMLTDQYKSYDGNWYICHHCRRTIHSGRIPPGNEKHYRFQINDLPPQLTTSDMRLNRCEAHLLKLVIPFIRVAHIPRSREFRVIGSMISVEAEIGETIETLLPVDQDLIPVALKRRPEYRGNFIEEVVSKQKILAFFHFLKENNPLYRHVNFDMTKLDHFLSHTLECITDQDEWKTSQASALDNVRSESYDVNTHNEGYDLPGYLTECIADTVIDPLTKTESTCHVTDRLASAIIHREQTSTHQSSNSQNNRMPFLTVVPTAASKFRRWEECEHLEEKCFPHLFPNGTGGYLSTYQEKGVGFANYIKQRILGNDCRYRQDSTYMFFLFNVKEQIEIKRSCATFFRQSKLGKGKYTAQFFKNVDKQEIERTDLGYKVFKNLRGTAPYFQCAKLKIMTMIRQLGSPTLFLTLSSAESYWNDLIKMLL